MTIILTILAIGSGFAFIAVMAAVIRSSEVDHCQPLVEEYETTIRQTAENFTPHTYLVI
jgi:hypothetical protein